jgi:hypothetical protein
MGIDFHLVYASLLGERLRLPTEEALSGSYAPLPLFRASS